MANLDVLPADEAICIGRIRRHAASEIALKAAREIQRADCAMAVTVDPNGLVCVERPEDAVEDDIVGVYDVAGAAFPPSAIEGDVRWFGLQWRETASASSCQRFSCMRCDAVFTRKPSKAKIGATKYCSRACASEARRTKPVAA